MNKNRPTAPAAGRQLVGYHRAQTWWRPSKPWRPWLSWSLRRERRGLEHRIAALQCLLAAEFATLDTEPLHDALDAARARQADIDSQLDTLR